MSTISGANMLILCLLAYAPQWSLALTAKDGSTTAAPAKAAPAPAPAKTIHEEHHEARQELKKLLDGKSPTEISDLRKKIDKASSVVSTVASGVATVASAIVSSTKWPACPDGYSSQRSADGCCNSQALKHLKQAKMLCEADAGGWKTAQAAAESFTCCPPAQSAAPAPSSGKEKEVADLKAQVAALKAQLQKDGKDGKQVHEDVHKDGGKPAHHTADVVKAHTKIGQVHHEVDHKANPKDVLDKELQKILDIVSKPTHSTHPSAHPSSHHSWQQSESDYRKQQSDLMSVDPDDHMFMMTAPGSESAIIEMDYVVPVQASHHAAHNNNNWSHNRSRQQSDDWTLYQFFGVIVIVGGLWWYNNGSRHKDMRHVPIPGYGNVNTDRLFDQAYDVYATGGKNGECSDLFEAGYSGYGGATMKPMKNVGSSEFHKNTKRLGEDDLGL